ncbi:hypothetical protein mRhiFer1_008785 [Rhinolophus ferrumequinum]|uniref:Uncharacterized protein n=1 Tax=Rhinolophus ferrumequinum TaxID=59479 RepID=A0A7J7TNA5_RHIFE|nr:hypothetical protein mRhiFer1_008785 [Rhinolophus ferrumequinum]
MPNTNGRDSLHVASNSRVPPAGLRLLATSGVSRGRSCPSGALRRLGYVKPPLCPQGLAPVFHFLTSHTQPRELSRKVEQWNSKCIQALSPQGDTEAFGTFGSKYTPCVNKKSISAGSATSLCPPADSQEAGQVFQAQAACCQSLKQKQQKHSLAARCEQDKGEAQKVQIILPNESITMFQE